MHIFLTGDFQVGKSVIIDKIIQKHPCVCGYRTVTRWDGELPGSVYIIPAADARPVFDETTRVMIRHGCEQPPEVFPQVFDDRGCELLRNVHGLIIMDEIGKAENNAPQFIARIKELLDGNIPVLGVLRKEGATDIQEYIRNHAKVRIIGVTEENRDMLADELLREFL